MPAHSEALDGLNFNTKWKTLDKLIQDFYMKLSSYIRHSLLFIGGVHTNINDGIEWYQKRHMGSIGITASQEAINQAIEYFSNEIYIRAKVALVEDSVRKCIDELVEIEFDNESNVSLRLSVSL